MASTIQAIAASPGTGLDDSSVAREDTLARCKQQLGDWNACSSGKTPEGQKIIAALHSRIAMLESKAASEPSPPPQAGATARENKLDPGAVVNTFV